MIYIKNGTIARTFTTCLPSFAVNEVPKSAYLIRKHYSILLTTKEQKVSELSYFFSNDIQNSGDLGGITIQTDWKYCISHAQEISHLKFFYATKDSNNLIPFRLSDLNAVINPASPTKKPIGPQQTIQHIRDVMQLSISEIASIFNVSRQALYGWKQGSTMSPENQQRLAYLADAAEVFEKKQVNISPFMLRRQINGKSSIIESAKHGKALAGLAEELSEILIREANQQKRLSKRLSSIPMPDISSVTFGVPHLVEEQTK